MAIAQLFEQTVADAIASIQRDLGLTSAEVAGGLGVTTRTLDRWRKGQSLPQREARERLNELSAVRDHALEAFYPDDLPRWMRERNRALAGTRPVDAIAVGRLDQVENALVVIDYGMFV